MYSINIPINKNYIGYVKGSKNKNIEKIEKTYNSKIKLKYDEIIGNYFKIEGKYGDVLYSSDEIIHLILCINRKNLYFRYK